MILDGLKKEKKKPICLFIGFYINTDKENMSAMVSLLQLVDYFD